LAFLYPWSFKTIETTSKVQW